MYLLRLAGRSGLVAFCLREQCPCGTGGLVGDGDGNKAGRFALQERPDPGACSGVGGRRPPRNRDGANNQQPAQIAVAHLRYMPETVLAARRVLSGHKAKIGRKLPAGFEDSWIGHTGSQRSRRDKANTRDRLEPLARGVLSMPRQKLVLNRKNLLCQPVELFRQSL